MLSNNLMAIDIKDILISKFDEINNLFNRNKFG